ncbi:MAG: BamA/TamA family outer membrane protein [Bacteroidia bacterium]|nr:BamA/TamA family outer membrane protein [Bacteroidia bacterium]MDG2042067.1 BamA/TamA family outer membrane protein [Bacteroidia bacterium]
MSLTACHITRVVPDGEQLLVKNRIDRGDVHGVDLSDEGKNLKQKPNRKLLGFIKFHLWAYQYGKKGLGIRKKQRALRRLAEKVGEPPVLIDSNKIKISAQKLSDFYFGKGYFNNKVWFTVKPKLGYKKRAKVIYHADLNNPYQIQKLKYLTSSKIMEGILRSNSAQQRLDIGQRIDFQNIEYERNRITELFRNRGFYTFNSSHIDFEIDTSLVENQASVVLNIRNLNEKYAHTQHKIECILVKIDDASQQDTILYQGIQFLEGSYYINPSTLSKNIIFRVGELYQAEQVQKTYANLLSMDLFEFVTIRFNPSSEDSTSLLTAEIILQTAPKHDFTWEPQAIYTDRSDVVQSTSDQNFGIANNFRLNNRNVFGSGESFSLSSLTAFETQIRKDNNGTLNGFRQSVNAELKIPSLVYFERKKISQSFTKKNTRINLSFLHDRNVSFTRNVIPFNFTYAFSKNRFSFGITPLRISINQAKIDPDFLSTLDNSGQFYTSQLLTNNIIAGPKATIHWNNKTSKSRSYWQIKSNALELSGNLTSLYFDLFTNETGKNREIFGVKYSQYARSDVDLSYTFIWDENNSLAYRFNTGVGLPYGNTEFLPFERRFFVGGGNSLRAWRPRTLGPGGYGDSSNAITIEKTGEVLLQASAEYRFDIIDKLIDGAIFFDAGNIWNFTKDENFPDGEFRFNRFYKELALNSGVGIRFDFSYVVFRVDWGISLHDPSLVDDERWIIKYFSRNRWIFDHSAVNFAIGFPF